MDHELDGPTLIPGWSRRRLIGHVGYQARALSRIVAAARTGQPWQSVSQQESLAEQGAAMLPARALRNLFKHSEVHLNVEWRDLEAHAWNAKIAIAGGSTVAVRDTPANRAITVWIHAVDLATTGSMLDFPPDFLDWLGAPGTQRLVMSDTGRTLLFRSTDRPMAGCPTRAVQKDQRS
jgi:maleylpyruvate isomerase